MDKYSVKQVAKLAKVSVRTLHLYDHIGLLKPAIRTAAGYRLYGEPQLLRLQQILFYKQLDIPLQQIGIILDNPDFDLVQALKKHKAALKARRHQIATMLATIDKTIGHLKNKDMLNHEELYEGFPKEEAAAIRKQATEKWPKEVEHAEKAMVKMGKESFKALKQEQNDITANLILLMQESPESPAVQFEIARHYQNIRRFWGTENDANSQAAQYAGLGQLYLADNSYTRVNNEPNADFALFMSKAMKHFAETKLV
ncbi:DNA-binding transcriptional regulator, MerR family [Mucilaginibacter polytrichastri]|nr:DNA-binding transcriptional regulator, MerR family [Mucilaginibacter polytrichastri]